MHPTSPFAALCVVLAVLAVPRPGHAQDSASAQALFDLGVSEMEAGHFAKGCPALEESHRLEPRPGTLFALADCQASWGKLASAVGHYQDYLGLVSRLPADQQARHAERVAAARAQVRALQPKVPTLQLVLPSAAPPGTVVERDGVALGAAALGLALPVDPGTHRVVSRAPGLPERVLVISIALGEAKRVEIEIEHAAHSTAGGRGTSGGEAVDASLVPPASGEVPGARGARARKTWIWTTGAIGVAGLAVGTVTGAMVLGKKSTVDKNCGQNAGSADPAACNESGLSAADRGKSLATLSTVGFAVGLGGLAVATVLLVTAPSERVTAAEPRWQALLEGTPGGAWAGVRSRF